MAAAKEALAKQTQIQAELKAKQQAEMVKKKEELRIKIEAEVQKREAAGETCGGFRGCCHVMKTEWNEAREKAKLGMPTLIHSSPNSCLDSLQVSKLTRVGVRKVVGLGWGWL